MGRAFAALAFISALFVSQSTDLADFFNKARQPNEKVRKIEFYVRPGGPDGYQITVASAAGVTQPPNLFGLINIADYKLTTGPSPTSPVIGRAHGLFASSSLTDFSLFTGLTLVFEAGKYNGSTLNILGYDPTAVDVRELPVVGGTGAFRLARGTVVFAGYHGDPSANYTIEKLTVTVLTA